MTLRGMSGQGRGQRSEGTRSTGPTHDTYPYPEPAQERTQERMSSNDLCTRCKR
jgi:hypothetical protein